MQLTFVFWLLISSAIITSSVSDGSMQKRSLSFFTNVLSNSLRRTQERCSKSNRKPSKQNEIFEMSAWQRHLVKGIPAVTRRKVPKRVKNNDNFFINLASESFQAISWALGGVKNTLFARTAEKTIKQRPQKIHNLSRNILTDYDPKITTTPQSLYNDKVANDTSITLVGDKTTTILPITSTEKTIKERPNKINNLSGNRLIIDHEPIITTTPENLYTNKVIYDTTRSQALGSTKNTLLVTSSAEMSIKEKPQKIQNLSGHRLTINHDPIVSAIPDNLNIVNMLYNRPQIHAMPPMVQYVKPVIATPRQYYYEQLKSGTVQKFSLDNNYDVIVTETKKQLPRPAYVDGRLREILMGVAPYVSPVYSTMANDYQQAFIQPNVLFGQQHENYNMNKVRSNYMSTYKGQPIIVSDDTPEAVTIQDNQMNRMIENTINEKSRGDIPD